MRASFFFGVALKHFKRHKQMQTISPEGESGLILKLGNHRGFIHPREFVNLCDIIRNLD